MKKLIRNFSLWLEEKTRKWVLGSTFWNKIDSHDISAEIELSDATVKWGNTDPEIVRANIYLRRLKSCINRIDKSSS